jgi:hypothetical protein
MTPRSTPYVCLGLLDANSKLYIYISHGSTVVVDYKFPRSHSDTSHSLGLLWTSNMPVAETSACQHTQLTKDRHPCSGFEPAVPA